MLDGEIQQENVTGYCDGYWHHSKAHETFAHRHRTSSFLWSVVRHPVQRLVSHFFYQRVSKQGVEPLDEHFREFIQQGPQDLAHHYLKRLSLRPIPTTIDRNGTMMLQQPMQVIQAILKDYDFIGVTERMEESMVVLSMLLDVPLADILYLSGRQHGTFVYAPVAGACRYVVPSFVSPGMQAYFNTPPFNKM